METVKTLSATKQRRSLGETSKKEKAMKNLNMKKPTRTTVVNPSGVEWPDVDEEASKELLALIEKSAKCLKIPSRKVPLNEIRTVPTAERSEFRKKWVSESAVETGYDISNYIMLRTTITLGVNCVSRALEMGQLVGVIIEKEVDPQIITKLLIPIANSKGIPIISVSGLNPTFKKASGIRCTALGFKKPCESVIHQFYHVLEAVKQHSANLNANECGEETTVVGVNPFLNSSSLLSSQSDISIQDEREDAEPVRQLEPQPELPLGPISIAEDIAKLEEKMKAVRKSLSKSGGSGYKPPKIRRVTPK